VKRHFPDYQERNQTLFEKQGIYTPVHIILMGGKLNREHPELARTMYDAFQRAKEIAVQDALGDGAGPSLVPHVRERFRDQHRSGATCGSTASVRTQTPSAPSWITFMSTG